MTPAARRTSMVVAAVLVLAGCGGQNAARLHVLRNDGLWRCPAAAGLTLDSTFQLVGSSNGIGFGGTTPTELHRLYRLDNADEGRVVAVLASCARASGWAVQERVLGADMFPTATGTKSFSGGWQASILIAARSPRQSLAASLLEIDLETDAA